jgi:pyruvate/2-oxoglutarate dehydrogenase complex dihydrolipoamide acyltransferase (E2) component
MPEFSLPDLGEGVTEGEVVEWRVVEGAQVARDQILVVIGTDKATLEIPSPYEGTVEAILAPAGAMVKVGDGLVRVGAGPAPVTPPTSEPAHLGTVVVPQLARATPLPRDGGVEIPALPSVRREARDRSVDLQSVPGSGPSGRVRRDDLAQTGRRAPLRGPQRVMAERMAEAHRRVPQVTVVLECDMGPVEALLATRLSQAAAEAGFSILGLIALATLRGLAAQPVFNAGFDERRVEIVYQDEVHLGIAVQAPDGLKVATLRDAGNLAPAALQRELVRVVAAARTGSLTAAELAGSTFTISNGGRLGALFATTLVNWPNLATLGVHEIEDRPVVRAGRVEVGRCLNLSLSFDHRVIDGMAASQFLYTVRERLVDPTGLID